MCCAVPCVHLPFRVRMFVLLSGWYFFVTGCNGNSQQHGDCAFVLCVVLLRRVHNIFIVSECALYCACCATHATYKLAYKYLVQFTANDDNDDDQPLGPLIQRSGVLSFNFRVFERVCVCVLCVCLF